jgi:YgiT-type zinc finger domain-containing protein
MVGKCYFCKGKVADQQITVDYRWGDTLVVIKDVPAGVCEQCGEKYLSGDVYKELERLAKSKSHFTGEMTVGILNFEESPAP